MKKNSYKTVVGMCMGLLLSVQAAAQSRCDNQVPVFNNPPSSITSSGEYTSSNPAWMAFDGTPSTMWISGLYQSPAWIAYQFSSAKKIDRYSIDFSNGPTLTTRAPRDFELQGYSNGSWQTLDRRVNQTNWLGSERRSFTVSQPGYYTNYRLYIEQDNDQRAAIVVVSIGDLSLETCGCDVSSELVPVLNANSSAVSVSGVYGSSPGWQAFDGTTGTMWHSALWQTPAWIGYEWNSPRFVDSYALSFSNGPSLTSRAPKIFQLQGWNGASWITVDSRTNEINWLGSQTRHYTVQSPGSYVKYRLLVADDNDTRAGVVVVSLGTLSLKGCTWNNNPVALTSLYGDWQEDHNQSNTDIEHYVPSSIDLGPARFRNQISFAAGGTGKIYRLAPNDAHYFVNTTWSLSVNRLTVTFTDNRWPSTAGTYDYVYEVQTVNGANLRLKVVSKTKR